MFFGNKVYKKMDKNINQSPTKFNISADKNSKSNLRPLKKGYENYSKEKNDIIIFTIYKKGTAFECAEIICNEGDFDTISCISNNVNNTTLDTPFITDITAIIFILKHYGEHLRNKKIKFNTYSHHNTYTNFLKSLDIEPGLKSTFFKLKNKYNIKIFIN